MSSLALRPEQDVNRLIPGRRPLDQGAHVAHYGPLPAVRRRDARLLAEIAASGLTGRGGAGFPTATKLKTVAEKWRTTVMANGTEGEPMSRKDVTLMARNPHLVLDGLELAADLIGAHTASIAVSEGSPAETVLAAAIAERPARKQPTLAVLPHRFITGEESALVHGVRGGDSLPTGRRPFAEGILVQNVETLANLALIARYGASWFRSAGTESEPGTALATVSGAVRNPGVLEFELGTTLADVIRCCGGVTEPVDAVLIGGYFGRFLRADPSLPLTSAALKAAGGGLGARVIVAIPRSVCGLREAARVVRYMAGESAGQCGPCMFGLPALADALEDLGGAEHSEVALRRIEVLERQIARRGSCAHPDGVLGFVASALSVFGQETDRHRHGVCGATSQTTVLATPTPHGGSR